MKIEKNRATSKNPFTTPEGYFDTLPERILARLHSAEEQQGSTHTTSSAKIRTIGTSSFWHRWSYAAALVLLFTIGGYLYYNDISSIDNKYANIDEYSSEYFEELYYTLDIDDYTIYNYLASSDTDF